MNSLNKGNFPQIKYLNLANKKKGNQGQVRAK